MREVRFTESTGSVRSGRLADDEIQTESETHELDDVEILPPCDPSKIICVAQNYYDALGSDDEAPETPFLFIKTPNTIAAHGQSIDIPARFGREIKYEAELAVVIGKQCCNIAEADTKDVIKGYTCANDLTSTDFDNIVRRKAFDNSSPVGPAIASPESIPEDATIELRVNRTVEQSSSIDNMVFSIQELVAGITNHITLLPGDVILSGTPGGADLVESGDSVEVSVEGVGMLENEIELDD